jgi:hypothetical protein
VLFASFVPDVFYGYNRFDDIFLFILITVQLFGIQYFLNKIRFSFGSLKIRSECGNKCYHPLDELRKNFTTSRIFYAVVLLVFLPFAAIPINSIFRLHINYFFFQESNSNQFSPLFDIYTNLTAFFMLYLLAVLIWMILNISWTLDTISNRPHIEVVKIDLLDADKMGGLRPIRNLIVWFSVYYFLVIVLAVLSYLTQRGLLLYESISLLLFWIIGVLFFLWGWFKITKILLNKVENEVSSLNEISDNKRKQLLNLISKDQENENEKQINLLSLAIEAISKERNRVLQSGIKPIDAKTLILFLSSSFFSLIWILNFAEDTSKNEIVKLSASYIQPYLNETINLFHQFLPI